MKIAIFCESIVADIEFNDIHFLRGAITELLARGHEVRVFEKENNASVQAVIREFGKAGINEFKRYYPTIDIQYYKDQSQLKKLLTDVNLVIVHYSVEKDLIDVLVKLKKINSFLLLYHDVSTRILNNSEAYKNIGLESFDAILAGGNPIKEAFIKNNICKKVVTWYEGIDQQIFHPRRAEVIGHLVWVNNWKMGEDSSYIEEFLIQPVRDLRIKAKVFGSGYPKSVKKMLAEASIEFGGWIPSFKIPELFAKYTSTIHLPGTNKLEEPSSVPQSNFFQSIACGIPVISAPWRDPDNLFISGREYLLAKNGYEMKHFILEMMNSTLKEVITGHGVKTITKKHTCANRINELEQLLIGLGIENQMIFPKKHSTIHP